MRGNPSPALQRTARLSWRSGESFADRWVERVATRTAYLKIDGRPVLSILNVRDFASVYGTDGLRLLLSRLRSRLRDRLGLDPFLLGLISSADSRNIAAANALPIDAVTGYALLPDWAGPPVQDYETLIRKRVAEWHRIQPALKVPFLPVVCAGWDATVRGEHVGDLRKVRGFPWRPVVVGATPDGFGGFLDQAIAFNERFHPDWPIVFLHAWNEWTEASAIEPSDRFGSRYLQEVAKRANDAHFERTDSRSTGAGAVSTAGA